MIQKGFNSATTECPKIKLAFGKYLDIALHGFLMGIFNPKLFSPDSSGPLLREGFIKKKKNIHRSMKRGWAFEVFWTSKIITQAPNVV